MTRVYQIQSGGCNSTRCALIQWFGKSKGTVYLSFIVDTSGMITNVKLLHEIFADCDAEAIHAEMNMPK